MDPATIATLAKEILSQGTIFTVFMAFMFIVLPRAADRFDKMIKAQKESAIQNQNIAHRLDTIDKTLTDLKDEIRK